MFVKLETVGQANDDGGVTVTQIGFDKGTAARRSMAVNCTIDQFNTWLAGVLIQDAMPHASADEREFCITGWFPEEWEETFGTEQG